MIVTLKLDLTGLEMFKKFRKTENLSDERKVFCFVFVRDALCRANQDVDMHRAEKAA